eukprot:scaffold67146_cov30-Tisochrysis_lutea.AAC.1
MNNTVLPSTYLEHFCETIRHQFNVSEQSLYYLVLVLLVRIREGTLPPPGSAHDVGRERRAPYASLLGRRRGCTTPLAPTLPESKVWRSRTTEAWRAWPAHRSNSDAPFPSPWFLGRRQEREPV